MSDRPRQLAVISGKGGTGKTSATAALAVLAEHVVLADCDVDAPNLHLLLSPRIWRAEAFSGGRQATVDAEECCACGRCAQACRFGAIALDGPPNGAVDATCRVDPLGCEGCGVCVRACPTGGIHLVDANTGQWFVSATRAGPMVHARLHPGQENSGKLVSLVRQQARQLALKEKMPLVLIDGAPGIGCAVIASITGVDHVLLVTEPSQSGLHDLLRALDLAAHFRIPASVAINRWDIEPALTDQIEAAVRRRGAAVAGRIRYDRAVVEAQAKGLTAVEYSENGVSADIRALWDRLSAGMGLSRQQLTKGSA